MNPITDQQLDHLTALAAAATPGPWHLTDSSDIVAPLTADTIADVWEPTAASRNGEFIEAAREAMPALVAEVRRLRADRSAAALAEVRRFCELTIRASVRVQAIDQARDTLAVIDSVMGDQQDDEDLSGPCDCGEGAVHYTDAECPAAQRAAARSAAV